MITQLLTYGLPSCAALAVVLLSARARRRRRRWHEREDSVAAIAARIQREPLPARQPRWPRTDPDLHHQREHQPTLRIPRITKPPKTPDRTPTTRRTLGARRYITNSPEHTGHAHRPSPPLRARDRVDDDSDEGGAHQGIGH